MFRDSTDYFNKQALRDRLATKVVRGGGVVALTQPLAILINVASIPILTRLLEKEDFGLVNMATVFGGFAAILLNTGFADATVQREDLNTHQVTNLFWCSSALGALVAAVVALTAPLVAWFYEDPRVTPLLQVIAVSFLLRGLTMQHQALLRRGMRLATIAAINLVAQAAGQAAGILFAFLNRNEANAYWALVIIAVAPAALILPLSWLACSWRPGLPRRNTETASLLRFGANLTAFDVLNYGVRNLDNVLIGYWWGPGALGVYDTAYRLFLAPLRTIIVPLKGVLVPALSRARAEPEKYRRVYLGAMSKLTLFVVPLVLLVTATADLVVPVACGPGWDEAVPILRVLSLVAAAQVLSGTFAWLYISQDRTDDMLRWIMLSSPALILSFVLGVSYGAFGVAAAYVTAKLLLVFPAHVFYVCRTGPVAAGELFGLLVYPLTCGAVTVASVMAVRPLLPPLAPPVELLIATAVGAAAGMATIALIPATRRDLIAFSRLVREKL